MAKLNNITVELSLPGIGSIQGNWSPDETEQRAAWELYVELVTRISTANVQNRVGSIREALSSLHSLFGTTRQILKTYGPDIARPKGNSVLSLGYISVTILNNILRPFLMKWHPLLLDFEAKRPENTSLIDHEDDWEYYEIFRQELRVIQETILDYANLLAEAAKVPKLLFLDTKS